MLPKSPARSPAVDTNDIRRYLARQSGLCDSRIEKAYMKLSAHQERDASAGSRVSFDRHDRGASKHSGAGLSRSASHLYTRPDMEHVRPATAPEPRSHGSNAQPRGILKKSVSAGDPRSVRVRDNESPDAWFQRVMQFKKLTPLDLCELFSYGDARKHPRVPLSHVCEVLFDLDPDSANGADPVTEEMEDFLYQFAVEDCGEIMVNVKEALRSLDIWQSRVVAPSRQQKPGGMSSRKQVGEASPSRAVVLESKNRKLQGVISNLQDANLRLSLQLEAVATPSKFKSSGGFSRDSTTLSPQNRAAVTPLAMAEASQSGVKVSPVKPAAKREAHQAASPKPLTRIINRHEEELVHIANVLQYTGARQLEDLLVEGDVKNTGFVSLKQLQWLLADRFELEIGEAQLMEICMGMNFNEQAQLDYQEFVRVLDDILIYAFPNVRESSKQQSLVKLEKYLQSGFPPDRADMRQLLDALCSKYDSKGDECISLAQLVRVFHVDLAKHHALGLPYPLTQSETLQLAQPFVRCNGGDTTTAKLLPYLEFLNGIFGPFPVDLDPATTQAKQVMRALRWDFWQHLRMTLCNGSPGLEPTVHAQLSKIFAKVDAEKDFTIPRRHLQRVFEKHISMDDLDVIATVLEMPQTSKSLAKEPDKHLLRYDVLLKLVFGTPDLEDDRFFQSQIRTKLIHEETSTRGYITGVMTTYGAEHQLTLEDLHDTFVVQAPTQPLTTTELLYLFAAVDVEHQGALHVKSLWNFLKQRGWSRSSKQKGESYSAWGESGTFPAPLDRDGVTETDDPRSIKTLIVNCCATYNLERALAAHARGTSGWISSDKLILEMEKMLHELGVEDVRRQSLKQLVELMTDKATSGKAINYPSARDTIHIDSFFDDLFDWNSMIHVMRLPGAFVDVKKAFENFDWDHNGTIPTRDWNKAWRLICPSHQGMAEWEIHVVQRRFPSKSTEQGGTEAVDYTRLLVFLLDYQQRHQRSQLLQHVRGVFQRKFSAGHGQTSTLQMEKLFQALDTDGKGYFNSADLKSYLASEFTRPDTQNTTSENDESSALSLLENRDALAYVMRLLAGNRTGSLPTEPYTGTQAAGTVVTFERFCEIAHSFSTVTSCASAISPRRKIDGSKRRDFRLVEEPSRQGGERQTISSLRAFEVTILEIASEFSDTKGNILPAKAFRYFSLGPTVEDSANRRQSPSSSPPKSQGRMSPGSPNRSSRGFSLTNRSQQRELQASPLDPFTPARLKQLLQIYRHLDVSTHLISQFFLHIGSPSKYFLELLHFAQWAAPISVELQSKVRAMVRHMIVKGKGGGGKVDLDRFLAQLYRRLLDSPLFASSTPGPNDAPLQFVPASLLLSKLHLLNIPLNKQELVALLRHFGMEDDLESVDYALFLQRVYELNAGLSAS